ncbi:putative lysin [Salmonella phage 21]|nr:putative lysin [Salmonella phage 21]
MNDDQDQIQRMVTTVKHHARELTIRVTRYKGSKLLSVTEENDYAKMR